MATCPTCGGALGDRHECPPIWKLRLRAVQYSLFGALAGAIVGAALPFLIGGSKGRPSIWAILAMAAAGVLVERALRIGGR